MKIFSSDVIEELAAGGRDYLTSHGQGYIPGRGAHVWCTVPKRVQHV